MITINLPRLTEIYGMQAEAQALRYQAAVSAFRDAFREEPLGIFRAPGRTEICGNHTDHQGGQVLAAAIEDDAIAAAAPAEDGRITLISAETGALTISLDSLAPRPEEAGTTAALVRGVAAGCLRRGIRIPGAKIWCTSNVPMGSGMSSSAAFEIMLGAAFSGLGDPRQISAHMDLPLNAVALAKIGQDAENRYFGKPCGLMDQLSSASGSLVHIDFYEEEPALEVLSPAFLASDFSICITDCRSSHADLTEEYAAIPREMQMAAAVLDRDQLGRTTTEELIRAIPEIRSTCGDRAALRALHYTEENRRVALCAEALKRNDPDSFLRYFRASGESSAKFLQNVSCGNAPQSQSLMLGIAVSEQYLGSDEAVRVHGGGFAGTIQALVRKDRAEGYRALMDSVFGADSCRAHRISRFGGIRVF